MNLYFNDLTITRDEAHDRELFWKFAQVFYVFSKVTGEQHVWAPRWVKDYLKTFKWTLADMQLWSWLNATLGLLSPETPRESEEVEERFLSSRFSVRMSAGTISCDQMGLSILTRPTKNGKGLSVGLSANAEWRRLVYEVVEASDDGFSREHLALCLVEVGQVNAVDVREWCQCAYVRKLPTSKKLPNAKRVHLRDDHGKDVLRDLANRLVMSPYVEEIINSLPFNPRATKFIEKVSETGLVEIRLTKTPQGLGLVVQTTGCDLDATERIARVLQEKFAD